MLKLSSRGPLPDQAYWNWAGPSSSGRSPFKPSPLLRIALVVLILFWFSLFYCLNQNKIINKLNNEKKHLSEYGAKSCEDLQIASDKVEYLNKIKQN